MGELSGGELLHSFARVNWVIAAKTYGNNHATLIGLFVNWWISLAPERHLVLEGGPSFGKHPKGKGGGMCDAVFCRESKAVGILEVEGSYPVRTIGKVGRFFDSELDHLKALQFAIVALYPTGPKRGTVPSPETAEALSEATTVSREHPGKPILTVPLQKEYDPKVGGINMNSPYYKSRLSLVRGSLFENGTQATSRILWPCEHY